MLKRMKRKMGFGLVACSAFFASAVTAVAAPVGVVTVSGGATPSVSFDFTDPTTWITAAIDNSAVLGLLIFAALFGIGLLMRLAKKGRSGA